jgi:hypothetical protein
MSSVQQFEHASASVIVDGSSFSGSRHQHLSFIAGHTDKRSNPARQNESVTSPFLTLRKVERLPSDEIILTELMFDAKELITYDITSSVLMAEEEYENPQSSLRCYMDVEAKEFFIEISTKESMGTFSKSTLINIVKLAEENGAEVVYICLKKTIENKNAFLKNFMFLGFEKLNSEEQKRISKTKTHGLLKYTINGQEEQDDA